MTKYIYSNGRFHSIPSNIYQTSKGKFEIRKKVGGVLTYWGTYHTLEEARLYRAYYIGKKWMVNPHFMNRKYIYENNGRYTVSKMIEGHTISYGTFNTLKEAISERDICIKCNWDFDLIVEEGMSI